MFFSISLLMADPVLFDISYYMRISWNFWKLLFNDKAVFPSRYSVQRHEVTHENV
jgi:hypothetical protein